MHISFILFEAVTLVIFFTKIRTIMMANMILMKIIMKMMVVMRRRRRTTMMTNEWDPIYVGDHLIWSHFTDHLGAIRTEIEPMSP